MRARIQRGSLWCLIACAAGATGQAADFAVSVHDRNGHAVADVVVIAMPSASMPSASMPSASATRPASPERIEAIMDQHHMAFVPQVLVVAVGSDVRFPNNDTVSHQVYSFSPAKRFQLPLYKGAVHPPVNFDRPGLVVLGCNIHDQMVGYIYVTDAPYFGKTDLQGRLHWSMLPPDRYTVTFWSPYIADPAASLVRAVQVTSGTAASADLQLTRDLRSRPEPRPRPADWVY